MELSAKQVTFLEGGAVVAGEPVDDGTKVVVATLGGPGEALGLAMAVASGMQPVIEVTDEQVVEVLEKPKPTE